MQQIHKHKPKGKTQKTVSQHSSLQKNTIPRNGWPHNSHPPIYKTFQMDLQWVGYALRWHWRHDTKVSCQKTRHTPVHKSKGTPWPLAPGPGPSILLSLLPNRCSEQAAAGNSRRQQAAAGSKQRQQQRAGSSTEQQAEPEKNFFKFEIVQKMKRA